MKIIKEQKFYVKEGVEKKATCFKLDCNELDVVIPIKLAFADVNNYNNLCAITELSEKYNVPFQVLRQKNEIVQNDVVKHYTNYFVVIGQHLKVCIRPVFNDVSNYKLLDAVSLPLITLESEV